MGKMRTDLTDPRLKYRQDKEGRYFLIYANTLLFVVDQRFFLDVKRPHDAIGTSKVDLKERP